MLKSRRSLYPDRRGGIASPSGIGAGGPVSVIAALAALAALIALTGLAGLGCGSSEPAAKPPPEAPVPTARGAPVAFELATIDKNKKPLSTATLAGRISVIAFLATYDMASQAQARFLADLVRSHKPRINAAVIILELPENKPMVEAFVAALEPPYPVAMADPATLAGEGPFRGLHHVPSIVILDRQGREAYRRLGLIDTSALEEILREVERTSPPPGPEPSEPPAQP